jgi:hypothetical protein
MSASRPLVDDCLCLDHALFWFPKTCTGDNADDSLRVRAVVSSDIDILVSDPLSENEEWDDAGDTLRFAVPHAQPATESAQPQNVQPQNVSMDQSRSTMHVVGSEAHVDSTITSAISIDDQPRSASMPAYVGPSGEEVNYPNIHVPEPTEVADGRVGASTRSVSPKLELVKKFNKPLTLDLLATIRREMDTVDITKKDLLFTLLFGFLLLPQRNLKVEGGQVWNDLVHREEFHELVIRSELNPAVMPDVVALLMYMKTKIRFIGESFFTWIASCLIGNGVNYCSSRTNATSQYRVLKAVYEAIIGKKPRKQRGKKNHSC